MSVDCVRGFAVLSAKSLTLRYHSVPLPKQRAFFVRQSDKFIGDARLPVV